MASTGIPECCVRSLLLFIFYHNENRTPEHNCPLLKMVDEADLLSLLSENTQHHGPALQQCIQGVGSSCLPSPCVLLGSEIIGLLDLTAVCEPVIEGLILSSRLQCPALRTWKRSSTIVPQYVLLTTGSPTGATWQQCMCVSRPGSG